MPAKRVSQFQNDGGGGWRVKVTTADGIEYFSQEMTQEERGTGAPVGEYLIRFDIGFDISPDHNGGTVKIYNVAPESISDFRRGELLLLEAGYQPWETYKQTVFEGTIEDVLVEEISDVTRLLTINVGDTTDVWATAVTSRAFRPGTRAKTAARALIRETGLRVGKLKPKKNPIYTKGLSIVGAIRPELEMLARDMRSKLHVSRRKVYILKPEAGIETGLVLSGENGLLRAKPAINLPADFHYTISSFTGEQLQVFELSALLTAEIWSDAIFEVDDDTISGEVRAVSGSHSCNGESLLTTVRVAKTLRGELEDQLEAWLIEHGFRPSDEEDEEDAEDTEENPPADSSGSGGDGGEDPTTVTSTPM